MKLAIKLLRSLLLALLPIVISGATHEELPHGEPSEDLVEKHRGSKTRIHH
jgi:hypothetical protein